MPSVSILASALIVLQSPGGGTLPPHDSTRNDTLAVAASRTTLPRSLLRRLPTDDPRDALTLVPGIAQRGNAMGIGSGSNLSLRLGSAGGASIYIDGAPARLLITGGQGVGLAMDALESIAVTTGLPFMDVDDGRGGVISYVTRSGGRTLDGHVLAHTDAPFGAGSSVGYNRFAGSAGGPLGTRFSWFASGEVMGQRSAYRGLGAADQPTFALGGPDTTVDTVTIPTFVRSTGLRRPLDWLTQRRAQTKVVFRYGAGASLALTGLLGDLQQRFFPAMAVGDPALYAGTRAWSRLAVLNWSQPLGVAGPLALHATLSLGLDRQLSGLLTPGSEAASRDPGLGIEMSALQFLGSDSIPLPLTDRIVRNIRSAAGLRTPFLGRSDLQNAQPYRLNPFGVATGWPTSGSDGTLSALSERRLDVRVWADRNVGASHQVRLGMDYGRASQTYYQADLVSVTGLDAWIAHPRYLGAFAADRIALGRLSLDLGARLDRITPGGEIPRTPGRIFTNPAWSLNTFTDDTAYANSVARVYAPLRSHTAVSPRLHAIFAVSPHTALWANLGRIAQLPRAGEMFTRSNADLAFTGAFDPHGSDVGVLKASVAELGVRHSPAASLTIDARGYFEHRGQYGTRIKPFEDPRTPGDTLGVVVVTPVDSSSLWGIEATVGWHPSGATTVRTGYAYARSGGTGFQSVTAMAILEAPALGSALRGVSATILARAASGLSYLMVANSGFGGTTSGFVPFGSQQAPLGHLPWSKSLDLRLAKELRAGGVRGVAYADVRNLLNLRSILSVFTETGGQTNSLYQATVLSPELATLHDEALTNGRLLANDAVDLRPDCATWGTFGGPVSCVALRRVEQRFGNGDGVYDLAEQTSTLNAYYESFFGAWRFNEPGRTIRIGMELEF